LNYFISKIILKNDISKQKKIVIFSKNK